MTWRAATPALAWPSGWCVTIVWPCSPAPPTAQRERLPWKSGASVSRLAKPVTIYHVGAPHASMPLGGGTSRTRPVKAAVAPSVEGRVPGAQSPCIHHRVGHGHPKVIFLITICACTPSEFVVTMCRSVRTMSHASMHDTARRGQGLQRWSARKTQKLALEAGLRVQVRFNGPAKSLARLEK